MVRILPPTAGMPAWRFIAQALLCQAYYGVMRTICSIFGHRWREIEDERMTAVHCDRCSEEHITRLVAVAKDSQRKVTVNERGTTITFE